MGYGAIVGRGLAAGEILMRHVYWRIGYRVAPWLSREESRSTVPPIELPKSLLAERLRGLGAGQHGLLMVHSSLDRFTLVDDDSKRMSMGNGALWLLRTLGDVVGPEGTLCTPTHPLYRGSPGFMYDKSGLKLAYSVRRTPSSVGLLTELFRRQPDTKRSLHPLSSLAASGPLTDRLLAGNLNDEEPLPHGRRSGYYRFCQLGGRVISIGLGLVKPLTVLHVAEEVRDAAWPVRGFFYKRRFSVEDEAGTSRDVVVRERRPEFVRAVALYQVRRDLISHGILHEGNVRGVRIDSLDARALLEFMTDRQRASTYPYLLPALAGIGKAPRPSPGVGEANA